MMCIKEIDINTLFVMLYRSLHQLFCAIASNNLSGLSGQISQPLTGTACNLKNIFPITKIGCKMITMKHPDKLLMGSPVSRDLCYSTIIKPHRTLFSEHLDSSAGFIKNRVFLCKAKAGKSLA